MWLERYAPKSLSELIGNPEAFTEIRLWANAWRQGKIKKPLLLVGPPGVGKTASAYALANELDWSLVEFNASDTRNKETVEKVVGGAALNASFSGSLRLVLLDEIDGIQGTEDKGGLSAILSVLKEARNPVILTANAIYGDKRLAGVRGYCKMLSFKKIPYPSIGKFLKEIADKEGIDYDAHSITELAKNSSGDVRAALMDLESLSRVNKKIILEEVKNSGYRERQENVFNVMRTLFVSSSLNEIRRARNSSEVDHDLLKRWVEENIPRQFPMSESLAPAFDALSRSDLFDGRIFRRQNYGFLRYSTELAAGVGLYTSERAHGWIQYQFPTILKRLSLMKGSSKKEVIQKIQTHLYGSRSRIAQELVFWPDFLSDEKKNVEWVNKFGFTDEELAFLLQTSPTSAKVKRLVEKAEQAKRPESVENEKKKSKSKSKREKKSEAPSEEVVISSPAMQEEDYEKQTSLSKFLNDGPG